MRAWRECCFGNVIVAAMVFDSYGECRGPSRPALSPERSHTVGENCWGGGGGKRKRIKPHLALTNGPGVLLAGMENGTRHSEDRTGKGEFIKKIIVCHVLSMF